MIRITINWNFISPSLQIMNGTLIIENIDNDIMPFTIMECQVKKEKNTLCFKGLNGKNMSYELFKTYENQIKYILDGYFSGICLHKDIYAWIDDSLNMTYKDGFIKKENKIFEFRR